MELLDTYLSLGLAATALIVLRILLTPLLLYNMSWSFKGFVSLLKGDAFPMSLYQSVVFFFSAGTLGYNILVFCGREVSEWTIPWSLMLQCTLMIGSIIALIGRRVAAIVDFERFYWLFTTDNLDLAVRVAHMNEADTNFTKGVIESAETTLALELARKAVNDRAT